ncbi:hypothetical protein ABZ876_14630 [Streptomyces sp. NPDC046931]|uniref:hypothetical protein n=1 Tax=Streptomyces sp. NPDC046931 TaxID=3154806 RepID=UPI0033FF8339
MVAGTMLLAGVAGSGVAMASSPAAAPPSVQTPTHQSGWVHDDDDDWGMYYAYNSGLVSGDDDDWGDYYEG